MNSAEIREMQPSDRDRDKVQEGNLKLAHSTEPKVSRGEKTEAESKCFHRKASSTPARLIVAFQHSFIFNKKKKAESSGLLRKLREEEQQWQKVQGRDILALLKVTDKDEAG